MLSAGYDESKTDSQRARVCVCVWVSHLNMTTSLSRARHWLVGAVPYQKKSLEVSANVRCPEGGKYHHALKGKVLSHKLFWVLAKNPLRGNSRGWGAGRVAVSRGTAACVASSKSNSFGEGQSQAGRREMSRLGFMKTWARR